MVSWSKASWWKQLLLWVKAKEKQKALLTQANSWTSPLFRSYFLCSVRSEIWRLPRSHSFRAAFELLKALTFPWDRWYHQGAWRGLTNEERHSFITKKVFLNVLGSYWACLWFLTDFHDDWKSNSCNISFFFTHVFQRVQNSTVAETIAKVHLSWI